MKQKISGAVIRRLPKYYRLLDELHSCGVARISSHAFSEAIGFTASQIRQDLNCFGGFGQQGYGYGVEKLRGEIAALLGIGTHKGAVLFGAGNLGRALLGSFDFARCGFELLAAFDVEPELIGKTIGGTAVLSLDELENFAAAHSPKLAVFAVPPGETDALLRRLEALSFTAVWNFTYRELRAEDTTLLVETVHFTESLMALGYQMTEKK